jgi:hypothetical protein
MPSRIALRIALLAVVVGLAGETGVRLAPAQSAIGQSDHSQELVVWTAVIPEAFPRDIYTWRLKLDGTYEEDGRRALTGQPVQETLTGRWQTERARMILRQDSIPYVFDGLVVGERYSGALYLNGRKVSRFCARKGEVAPDRCEEAAVTDMPVRQRSVRIGLAPL